jgi:hypothetical protein
VSEIDLCQLLSNSLNDAFATKIQGTQSDQNTNRQRSIGWVESVAANFRRAYSKDPEVRVFSKYHDSHRKDFGLNELLYDVAVCRVGSCTAYRGTSICFIKEAIWQIESEFAHDSRQAMFDFNKLVLGAAANKLFLGPLVDDPSRFLDVLSAAARSCTGTVYVALLAHPKKWSTLPAPPRIWKLHVNAWQAITCS